MATSGPPNILPDSRMKNPTTVIRGTLGGFPVNLVPVFCANCGAGGPYVPAENMTFAFYLCNPCAEKWGAIVGTYMMPDEVFWGKVKEAQIEKYGRELSGPEIVEMLKDENSIFSKLAKDRKNLTPKE